MKKILLATDGSNYALKSAAYLADLYKGTSDLEVTVLNILPSIPPLYREEHDDPGKYGTLALGRKGSTQAREFRLGSVVLKTVSEVKNCAAWVV